MFHIHIGFYVTAYRFDFDYTELSDSTKCRVIYTRSLYKIFVSMSSPKIHQLFAMYRDLLMQRFLPQNLVNPAKEITRSYVVKPSESSSG